MTPALVPTMLQDGDELLVDDRARSLADLYADRLPGRSREEKARAIVQANGAKWSTASINAWVLRTGGAMQPSGFARFTDRSVILLPAGGPRPSVDDDEPSATTTATVGAGTFAVLALVAWRLLRKKR